MSSNNSRRVPLEHRQRTESSCDRCKSRKQKCHKSPTQDKCRHCQKYGYDCLVSKPRKQRLYGSVETFQARLSLLESLVKGLLPEADLANIQSMRDIGSSLGIPLPREDCSIEASATSAPQEGKNEHLVHDQQGQGQYIGPASSYLFQMKLRAFLGRDFSGARGEMFLFGSNPTDGRKHFSYAIEKVGVLDSLPSREPTPNSNEALTPGTELAEVSPSMIDTLIRSYFDDINTDFQVLHESTFLQMYDDWRRVPGGADHAWLSCLLCVLILSARVTPVSIPSHLEEKWWDQVQALLPSIIFTSSVTSIQAMMLAALHLHNTGHRDACWTLTGAAIRIAFAVGLHRDDIQPDGSRVTQELRKGLWWTLYGFEQMQVSSHDRPSAIDNALCSTGPPHERICGMGTYGLPDYMTWSNRLVVLLGQVCRALPAAADAYTGPLSPAAGLIASLRRWEKTLPHHLSFAVVDALPPAFQRHVLLLHIQYHYIVSLITRYALLSRFSMLSKRNTGSLTEDARSMSEVCADSGRLSSQLLLKLETIGKFNSLTWWDVYYMYSSALILALSAICDISQNGLGSANESQSLLNQCANVSARQLQNPKMPGTMHRWATVVGELDAMTHEFVQKTQGSHRSSINSKQISQQQQQELGTDQEPTPQLLLNGRENAPAINNELNDGGSLMPADSAAEFPLLDLFNSQMGARSPQPPLNSYNGQFWQDVSWESIGNMLLGGEDSGFWNL